MDLFSLCLLILKFNIWYHITVLEKSNYIATSPLNPKDYKHSTNTLVLIYMTGYYFQSTIPQEPKLDELLLLLTQYYERWTLDVIWNKQIFLEMCNTCWDHICSSKQKYTLWEQCFLAAHAYCTTSSLYIHKTCLLYTSRCV